jgi:uncharacterized protein YqjF (DUF2071 family)
MLVNFRIEPEIIRRQLPSKFRPKLYDGFAISGICLIRLEQIRPKYFPSFFGVSSENAAHRIAVLWDDEQGRTQEGVFVPRRDTNSVLNTITGGRIFPGEYHQARFQVTDSGEKIDFEMKSQDGEVAVRLRAKTSQELPASSKFATMKAASVFFEPGSLGYSTTQDNRRMDGMTLKTKNWQIEPLEVQEVYSSHFSDETKFPKNSIWFDCALLMRNIEHEWHSTPDLHF